MKNKKEWNKENYLQNGTRKQNQHPKSELNTTIKEPGINESGIEAKKNGWESKTGIYLNIPVFLNSYFKNLLFIITFYFTTFPYL